MINRKPRKRHRKAVCVMVPTATLEATSLWGKRSNTLRWTNHSRGGKAHDLHNEIVEELIPISTAEYFHAGKRTQIKRMERFCALKQGRKPIHTTPCCVSF